MSALQQIGGYISRLMSGGTLEIVLLIVFILVALVVLVILLWVLWKLLVLAGKGLLWLFQFGSGKVKERSIAKREERLAAPPEVATGWSTSTHIGLRRALLQANGLAGPDAQRILVIAGKGATGLFRDLGLEPPGVGKVRIAANNDVVLIDATNGDTATLRRLARALPWRRPLDAIAAIVDPSGMPGETLQRASTMTRHTGMRLALHLVFPGADAGAWRVLDGQNGDTVCTQLAADAVRIWLSEGNREGMQELALAQFDGLPRAIDRALSLAPSSVDIASLSLGRGLRSAVAQTTERTRPLEQGGVATWAGVGALATCLVLTVTAIVTGVNRASNLDTTVDAAVREATSVWTVEGMETIPSAGRMRRMAGLGVRLADSTDFSPLLPLASLVPDAFAAQRLGAALLENYMLVPLADALWRQAEDRLVAHDDPQRWIDDAQMVSEWLAAWNALEDDPRDVDIRRLLVSGFGGVEASWADGTDLAMVRTNAAPPPPERGGLDEDRVLDYARRNFILTMRNWGNSVYTNGPVARAARRATDRSVNWREQHAALNDLRTALQDPAQQWLTAAQDQPDYAFEFRVLGRAVALPLLGQAVALEARAALSGIRLDARENAEYFILPEVGPLMVRSSEGTQDAGRGPSLALSSGAAAWLAFLDRIHNAGFGNLPRVPSGAMPLGPVTLDQVAVAEAVNRLRVFDQFAADLPAELPPSVAQALLREVASEIVVGIAISVEQALRSRPPVGVASEQARQLAAVAPVLDDLREIEGWLRERAANREADRVLAVRGRVEDTALAASSAALSEEDPLGVFPDPAADGEALIRRFERGSARLLRLYEEYAVPFLESGAAGSQAAVDWGNISDDIQAFARGDAQSALSALEGMVRAYAEDELSTCTAPRPFIPAGRDDYVVNAASNFRVAVDRACNARILREAAAAYTDIRDYFEREVAWRWPFVDDPSAPEIQASTMESFVNRLHSQPELLASIDTPLSGQFEELAGFWQDVGDGSASLRFRLGWRARPEDERLAEHLVSFDLEGVDLDEDGVYTWRYGAPFTLTLRLAQNSPYRFVDAVDEARKEIVLGGRGNGDLIRVFSGLSGGALAFQYDVLDANGAPTMLRVTGRVSHPDQSPMTMPVFPAVSAALRE